MFSDWEEGNCVFYTEDSPEDDAEMWNMDKFTMLSRPPFPPRMDFDDEHPKNVIFDTKVNFNISSDIKLLPNARQPINTQTEPIASTSAPFGMRYVYREAIVDKKAPEFIGFANGKYYCYFRGCCYKSSDLHDWKVHENSHIALLGQLIDCDKCGFRTFSRIEMNVHVRIHQIHTNYHQFKM